MPVEIADAVLRIAAGYLAIGAVFASVFIALGLRRVDPLAAAGALRFKVLIVPGIVALWPVLLVLWIGAHPVGAKK